MIQCVIHRTSVQFVYRTVTNRRINFKEKKRSTTKNDDFSVVSQNDSNATVNRTRSSHSESNIILWNIKCGEDSCNPKSKESQTGPIINDSPDEEREHELRGKSYPLSASTGISHVTL
ncbi:uncharacterized protein LOC143212013 [Lasioglossum baleicum]|uniref:uncharacterized protein LOC143212013 n=1 Tax=Lasioglossum baleicum TaxID=434251 RepID=UPI003FCDF96D